MDLQVGGQRVAYVRVSSTDQNPDRQYEAIGEVHRVFEDKVSGKTRDRPALSDLLAYVREGDHVRVASMDRLARSVVDLHELVDGLVNRRVSVEFVKESVSLAPGSSRPMDRLLLTVLGGIAEFERSLIRERQAEGIAAAKKKGVYDRPNSLSPGQVAEARHRASEGVPKSRIAREAGVSRTTLYEALAGRGVYASGKYVAALADKDSITSMEAISNE